MKAPFYRDATVVTGRQIYSGTYKGELFKDRHCDFEMTIGCASNAKAS